MQDVLSKDVARTTNPAVRKPGPKLHPTVRRMVSPPSGRPYRVANRTSGYSIKGFSNPVAISIRRARSRSQPSGGSVSCQTVNSSRVIFTSIP